MATIVGKHCESGDVIVRDASLPSDLAVGEVWPPRSPVPMGIGSRRLQQGPRPPVVFVRDGGWRVVVRRETYDDLLALDV